MIKFIYPEKDAFISNHPSFLKKNFGKDEILEVENRKNYIIDSDLTKVDAESRALIKFNLENISQSISSGEITNPKFYLKLKVSEFVEVPQNFKIIVNPISQSWSEGTGRYADEIETTGVSWTYRFAETMSWSGQTISASLNGGTWYDIITSESLSVGTGSISITNIDVGDTFTVSNPNGNTYNFLSDYNYTSESIGYDSASITFSTSSLKNFTRYTINGLQTSSITVVNKFTPDNCTGELYIGWETDVTTDATTTVEFTTESLYSGKKFVLSDSLTSWSFIATDNMNIPDAECGTRFFYVNTDNHHNVTSLSLEINDVDNFNVSSEVSSSISGSLKSSFLIITTTNMGEIGNGGYFLDFDDFEIETTTGSCGEVITSRVYNTQPTIGGTGSGLYSRISEFSNALSSITASHGIDFNINGDTIYFTSSVSGNSGFSIVSGSTEIFFSGSHISSSYSLKSDDISSNLYYFDTSSVLSESINNLTVKVNDTVDFISVTQSANDMLFTGSIGQDNISFQSGSTTLILSNGIISELVSSSISQSFLNETADLNVDVTPIVNSWLNNEIDNEGFILKNENLDSELDSGKVRFYSKDTNTIYVPRIEVVWDNQQFNTDGLEKFSLQNENIVKAKSVNPKYRNTDVERFRILSRVKYPEKTYSNQFSRYTTTTYLPKESQYAIKDAESEEFVIEFNNGTKISCDSSGSFFDLDMSTLPQERYYIIYIKVVDDNLTETFESSQPFKISR